MLDRDGREVQEMLVRLKKLKEDKVYETVMFMEQLNYRLNKEYDAEVARGIENGVYSRRPKDSEKGGDGLVGVLRSDKVEQQQAVGKVGEKMERPIR